MGDLFTGWHEAGQVTTRSALMTVRRSLGPDGLQHRLVGPGLGDPAAVLAERFSDQAVYVRLLALAAIVPTNVIR